MNGNTKVIVLDAETTGTDKRIDQVIELCIQQGLFPDKCQHSSKVWRFKPSILIQPEAQAVHGISAADLADCPRFQECASEVRQALEGADVIVGYNVSFDLEMIHAEFARSGQSPLKLTTTVVDAYALWRQMEPRTLKAAHERFAPRASFDNAHSAGADVAATGRVLLGMLRSFGLAGQTWEAIADICEPERKTWVGPSSHIVINEAGEPILNFGKFKGTCVYDADRDYLRWVAGKDFPRHVQDICKASLDTDRAIFMATIETMQQA